MNIMKKLFSAQFAGPSSAAAIKGCILGLSTVFLMTATNAADKMNAGQPAANLHTATRPAARAVVINVNLSVIPTNPLGVYLTPVGGGATLSFLCFNANTSYSVPPGVYNVKFTIPTSSNPFHQIEYGGSLIWVTPFPDLPTVSGGEINGLSVSSAITINVS
jgi:hypothetical protein